MQIKKWNGAVLIIAFLFCSIFGVLAWGQMQMKEANPKWTEDFRVSESDKKEMVHLINKIAEKYSLSKESVNGPSQLENREVYFFHYKLDDEIVMTLHDLKSGGNRLTLYFYGLYRVDGDVFEKDIKEALSLDDK
ncbi:MAG: hypothetical protein COC04_01300 [Gammaproteobacteria bacterium]|nr:MAG: hypothetical protein COC04_01300 [Gammaproteobacteria bacterium]